MNNADWLDDFPIHKNIIIVLNKDNCLYNSLRLSNSDRFTLIPKIITSHTPKDHYKSADEIIGLWYYDQKENPCKFRQDFIVNVGGLHQNYVAYVADNYNKCIHGNSKPISDFFNEYGNHGKFYHKNIGKPWMHQYSTIKELPDPILETITIMELGL